MAVTLTQLSQEVSKRKRASTLPLAVPYNPSEIPVMPRHDGRNANCSALPSRMYPDSARSAPHYCEFQPFYQSHIQDKSLIYQQNATKHAESKESKARSTDHKHESLPSSPDTAASPRSSESSQSTASWTSIEPDLLPPHSNPQALTQTQSHAFTQSQPIPAIHIAKDDIWDSTHGNAVFRIFREAAHMPKYLSTKPFLSITKLSNGTEVGTVRFHTLTSNSIELTVNSRKTAISHSGVLHSRWSFRSTVASQEKLFWKKDRTTGGAMLEDSRRHGHVVARMKGDLLTFERARLSVEAYDEIVLSAIAIAEAVRRHKRKSDIVDLASAIGNLTGSEASGNANGGGVTCSS